MSPDKQSVGGWEWGSGPVGGGGVGPEVGWVIWGVDCEAN